MLHNHHQLKKHGKKATTAAKVAKLEMKKTQLVEKKSNLMKKLAEDEEDESALSKKDDTGKAIEEIKAKVEKDEKKTV
jgi:hypothetical protein